LKYLNPPARKNTGIKVYQDFLQPQKANKIRFKTHIKGIKNGKNAIYQYFSGEMSGQKYKNTVNNATVTVKGRDRLLRFKGGVLYTNLTEKLV